MKRRPVTMTATSAELNRWGRSTSGHSDVKNRTLQCELCELWRACDVTDGFA